ncbi:hypothetical protein C7271_14085, partial [filamentous cyanobacterium CCP5]
MPIELGLLIRAVSVPASILGKPVVERLSRDEKVIALLKHFKLDPDHPPEKFSDVYAYALVEYGVDKPEPILTLFRRDDFRQIFRNAFDNNSPQRLLQAGEHYVVNVLEAGKVGTWPELQAWREANIDHRREFLYFSQLFVKVAKRTRTPQEVLRDHKLDGIERQQNGLHQEITLRRQDLERLRTHEAMRTEIARLAASERLALGAVTSDQEQCRAFSLAQQLKGWFETLDYAFEPYEVWEEDYFECIIQIPARRRFDRILVRGISGAAGLDDVKGLRQSVEAQKTDEGWLVSNRRKLPIAEQEIEKERDLFCYTFDELIDEVADFSSYVDWLEEEIKGRGVDRYYIPLGCRQDDIDPLTQRIRGENRYPEDKGGIERYIRQWLADETKEHVSVLGEFGTGKTWFVLHYAWITLQAYKTAKEEGTERPRLPLVITLRDYAKALDLENVLAGFFFTKHNIRLTSKVFNQLNRMGKLLLIFDGFDEMAARVDRQQMINNFWELAKVVVPGSKAILTCRTEHFPDAKEGRALLNAELKASTDNLTGEPPQFESVELEKFNRDQIRRVLSFKADEATVEQILNNSELRDLAERPLMVELILEALPEIEQGKPVDLSRVYLYAMTR